MSVATPSVIRWGTPRGRWVLAATVGASGLAMLDATTVNVALPAIGDGLGASVSGLQWTINAYTLTLASLILIAGSLADRYGRRRIFLIGIAWFGIASLFCAVAPSITLLCLARALQGIGGALLTPGSLAILQASFAPDDRGRAVGAWSGLGGIAAAVGPLLGGWLVSALSWRAIFGLNIPVAVGVIILTIRHVPETVGEEASRFDLAGALLGALGLGGLTWALIAAGDAGASAPVLGIGAAGIAALLAFVWTERHEREPLVPLSLFSSRQFTGVNLVTFAVYGGMAGLFFLLVVYLQNVVGYSPVKAGMVLLPITLLMLLLSPRAGALTTRTGPRRPMTIGPLAMAAGMLLLSRLGPDATWLRDVLPGTVIFGLGLSATVAPLTTTVLASADERLSGMASGVNNAVARAAALLAVAVLPVAAGLSGHAFQEPATFTRGFHVAMRISAALVALGSVLAWLLIRDGSAEGQPARQERRPPSVYCALDGPPRCG